MYSSVAFIVGVCDGYISLIERSLLLSREWL